MTLAVNAARPLVEAAGPGRLRAADRGHRVRVRLREAAELLRAPAPGPDQPLPQPGGQARVLRGHGLPAARVRVGAVGGRSRQEGPGRHHRPAGQPVRPARRADAGDGGGGAVASGRAAGPGAGPGQRLRGPRGLRHRPAHRHRALGGRGPVAGRLPGPARAGLRPLSVAARGRAARARTSTTSSTTCPWRAWCARPTRSCSRNRGPTAGRNGGRRPQLRPHGGALAALLRGDGQHLLGHALRRPGRAHRLRPAAARRARGWGCTPTAPAPAPSSSRAPCGDAARSVVGARRIGEHLAARRPLSVADYERIVLERESQGPLPRLHTGAGNARGALRGGLRGSGLLVLEGVKDYYRRYARS